MKKKNLKYIAGLCVDLDRSRRLLDKKDQVLGDLMRENSSYKKEIDRLKEENDKLFESVRAMQKEASVALLQKGTYRLLDVGEEIQDVDDYYNGEEWNPVILDMIGADLDEDTVPIRRKIKHS